MTEGQLKNMGELLRKGAKMLSESCPECNTPIFQLKDGTLLCPMCEKKVVIVPADTDTQALQQRNKLHETLNKKIEEVQTRLEQENDPNQINTLLETLGKLMDTLEKVKQS